MTTWQELLDLEPGLRQWQDDARSIAVHAKWDWYERWIPAFRDLRRDLEAVAKEHSLDVQEVRSVALAALIDCYQIERARIERQERQQRQRQQRGKRQ